MWFINLKLTETRHIVNALVEIAAKAKQCRMNYANRGLNVKVRRREHLRNWAFPFTVMSAA